MTEASETKLYTEREERTPPRHHRGDLRKNIRRNLPLHFMLLPAVVICIVFCYVPMYGIVIAFQNFIPAKGLFGDQTWVGWQNFEIVFSNPRIWQVIANTVIISVGKIVLGAVVPIIFALLLNEVRCKYFKKTVQTVVYFPYFLSWVLFAGILIDVLSPSTGIVNSILKSLGLEPVYFLGDPKWFRITVIVTDVFKTFGYNTIIYLAAIAGIDPTLYEAAEIDGAGRLRQTWHITLTGMRNIIILLFVLSVGNILNAGFDQVWSLLNNSVLETGDILDTFIYRSGVLNRQYGQATAVGLIKSFISLILIGGTYYFSYKVLDYRIF